MKLVLPAAPTVAASAAASLALLGSALDADTRPAATLLDAVQSGFVHEWLGPAVALAAIAAVDDDMVAAGADVGKAVDLQKRRDALQADLDGLWAEYDELDALLAVAA